MENMRLIKMAKLDKSNSKGFTLLEALITLFIVCLLATVGSLQLKEYRTQLVFYAAIEKFRNSFERASRMAVLKNQNVCIDYSEYDRCLIIKSKNGEERIDMPANLTIFNRNANLHNYEIQRNGSVSPTTLRFAYGKYSKKLRIQMTWGKIIYDEE